MKRRKSKVILCTVGIAIVSAAVLLLRQWHSPEPQELIIEITGIEGRAFEATIETDGTMTKVDGLIPARIPVKAHKLSWEVKRLEDSDNEKFAVTVHTPKETNWGGFAESTTRVRGGSIGPSGLRRKRAWLGRLHE